MYCDATLFFDTRLEALSVCETNIISLPSPEQASNLGYGIRLITSASTDLIFRESSSVSSSTKSFSGCQICIIRLECGMTIRTNNIKIKSDISSCSQIPAIELRLSLPDPLQSLIMEIPPLEDLPLFTTKAEAGANFLGTVRKELISSPQFAKSTNWWTSHVLLEKT